MESDAFVCVKILKLRLLSNILRHFVLDQDLPEDDPIIQLTSRMVQIASQCEHWETLVKQSEQFKEEKQRLKELSTSRGLPGSVGGQLKKMVNI
jgi:hypothetical protein